MIESPIRWEGFVMCILSNVVYASAHVCEHWCLHNSVLISRNAHSWVSMTHIPWTALAQTFWEATCCDLDRKHPGPDPTDPDTDIALFCSLLIDFCIIEVSPGCGVWIVAQHSLIAVPKGRGCYAIPLRDGKAYTVNY